jgi:CRP-like cAMP-binding protein
LFAGLAEEELLKICAHMKTENFHKGVSVIVQGEIGDRFYIIMSGRMGIFKEEESGREKLEAVLVSGDSFGEIALIENVPRSATAKTLEPVTLLSLHKKYFTSFVRDHVNAGQSVTDIIRWGHFLREIPLFADSSASQISQILRSIKKQTARAGEMILSKGDIGQCFYIIKEGKAGIYEEKGGKPVTFLGKGEIFGEISLIRNIPRTASVKAETDMDLFMLSKESFLTLMTSNLIASVYIEDLSSRRLAALNL